MPGPLPTVSTSHRHTTNGTLPPSPWSRDPEGPQSIQLVGQPYLKFILTFGTRARLLYIGRAVEKWQKKKHRLKSTRGVAFEKVPTAGFGRGRLSAACTAGKNSLFVNHCRFPALWSCPRREGTDSIECVAWQGGHPDKFCIGSGAGEGGETNTWYPYLGYESRRTQCFQSSPTRLAADFLSRRLDFPL